MKYLLGLFLVVSGSNIICQLPDTVQWKDQVAQDQYRFLVALPHGSAYQCAIFELLEMRACRFPSGPVRVNSIKGHQWLELKLEQYQLLQARASKLPVLCIDEGWLHNQQVSRSNRNLCGFALPWESGMAYVFDDLYEVENLSGLIVSTELLLELNLLPNSECDELDEIDQLIAGSVGQEIADRSLPYPLDKVKQFLGQAFIATLLKYHDWKDRVNSYWRSGNGK